MKTYYGYHIAPGFRSATVWGFCQVSKKRVSTDTCTVNRNVPKHERGPVLARFLKQFKITLS